MEMLFCDWLKRTFAAKRAYLAQWARQIIYILLDRQKWRIGDRDLQTPETLSNSVPDKVERVFYYSDSGLEGRLTTQKSRNKSERLFLILIKKI